MTIDELQSILNVDYYNVLDMAKFLMTEPHFEDYYENVYKKSVSWGVSQSGPWQDVIVKYFKAHKDTLLHSMSKETILTLIKI